MGVLLLGNSSIHLPWEWGEAEARPSPLTPAGPCCCCDRDTTTDTAGIPHLLIAARFLLIVNSYCVSSISQWKLTHTYIYDYFRKCSKMLSESQQQTAEKLPIVYPQEIMLWGYVGKWLGHSAQHKVYLWSITLQSTQKTEKPGAWSSSPTWSGQGGPALPAVSLWRKEQDFLSSQLRETLSALS